ncbi:NUDIX hydrolase [Halioglobus maricola]|uniref:NUDIX hydrolase n=1 Tax=Halioglobus maricola TaxID=2601894 RepID=A0A5P9NME9_9GAMM|nr:NUDIX domain-containing protein [Halioglobus maricola]QFU76675.1 NUDIX hydrolase [Halioglobus maricola]
MIRALCLLLPLLLAACGAQEQSCPFEGKADYAPSAGCLAVVHGKVLVIENLGGKISPPGGKALPGEAAQCAAFRETYEETGLHLMPGELIAVFDTGFHLYHCEIHTGSGTIDPALLEARRGFWLSLDEFNDVEWRFPGQGAALWDILNASPGADQQQ